MTTGMNTKEWVAVHRLHHKETDVDGDPHSPVVYGILAVLFGGAFLYRAASKNVKMVNNFGVGTPDDWVERNIYSRFNWAGVSLMLIINLLLFGLTGLAVWGVQMIWVPFWAAGVINGVGHYLGYRNIDTKDQSKNIVPLGILVGGEELHNSHHSNPVSPKFSQRWFEFDIGWMYICVLQFFRLATVRPQLA